MRRRAYINVTSEEIYELLVSFSLLLDEVFEFGRGGGEVPFIRREQGVSTYLSRPFCLPFTNPAGTPAAFFCLSSSETGMSIEALGS